MRDVFIYLQASQANQPSRDESVIWTKAIGGARIVCSGEYSGSPPDMTMIILNDPSCVVADQCVYEIALILIYLNDFGGV